VPALLLAGIFILAKVAIIWSWDSPKMILTLLAITSADVLVAVAFGVICGAALWIAQRNPEKHKSLIRFIWGGTLTSGALAAVYSVINVGVYGYLHTPLNARMFKLVGRLDNMRSSIAAQCSIGLMISLLATPAMYLILASSKTPRFLQRRSVRGTVLVLAVVWIGTGLALLSPDSKKRRAERNPHYEILASTFQELFSSHSANLGGAFPPEYLDDFKLAAEREYPRLATQGPRPKNVIIIVLESVAAQYMSVYGSQFDTTPNLSAETEHAMVLDRGYSQSGWTYLSRLPLLYGVAPGLPWTNGWRVVDQSTGLAKILRNERGYRTAFFSGGDPDWDGMYWTARDAGIAEVFGPKELGGRMASSWGTEDGILVDGLIRWIDSDPNRPFYAMMWTDQTHHPYTLAHDTQPIDFLDENKTPNGELLERYLNALRQADRHLGRLLAALHHRNLADDTIVVITGDHGEAFGDPHEQMVGHGGGLYEENIRVPLIFWNPRLFPTSQRSDRPGGHIDINPTLAHMLDIHPPDTWQGASLISNDHPGRAYSMASGIDYQIGVTDGRFKYIVDIDGGYERLYDLKTDPREQTDVAAQHRQVANEFRNRLGAFVQDEQRYLNRMSLPLRSEITSR
jgi:arylsulfatase A-like enzyme/F0F1-type ATP synthase membrane subunit c/vacuolar-type H+-ATPase subunit K